MRKLVGKILVGSLFALILIVAAAPVQAQLPASPRRFVDFLDVRCYQITNQPALNLPCAIAPLAELTAAARSRHPGGVNVLLADGSVRFIDQTIHLKTWQALGSIAGGEVNQDNR